MSQGEAREKDSSFVTAWIVEAIILLLAALIVSHDASLGEGANRAALFFVGGGSVVLLLDVVRHLLFK